MKAISIEEMDSLVNEFCELTSYNRADDWRTTPATFDDPDDERVAEPALGPHMRVGGPTLAPRAGAKR